MDVDPESCPACPTCCVYTCITHHRTSGPSPWHFTGTVSQQSVCICWLYLWDQLSVRAGSFGCLYLDSCHFLFFRCAHSGVEAAGQRQPASVHELPVQTLWPPTEKVRRETLSLWEHMLIIESPSHFSVYLNFLPATIIWGMTRHHLFWSATLLF